MSVQSVTPVLNVSSIGDSFAWFETLGWNRGFSWNQGGMIGSGARPRRQRTRPGQLRQRLLISRYDLSLPRRPGVAGDDPPPLSRR